MRIIMIIVVLMIMICVKMKIMTTALGKASRVGDVEAVRVCLQQAGVNHVILY